LFNSLLPLLPVRSVARLATVQNKHCSCGIPGVSKHNTTQCDVAVAAAAAAVVAATAATHSGRSSCCSRMAAQLRFKRLRMQVQVKWHRERGCVPKDEEAMLNYFRTPVKHALQTQPPAPALSPSPACTAELKDLYPNLQTPRSWQYPHRARMCVRQNLR